MTSAYDKTKNAGRQFLSIDLLDPQDNNPNSMSDAEFNMLCDNVELTGLTDPILVRPLTNGRYRIIGGHHRWEVAKLYDFPEVPVTIITDPDFDDDKEKFQIVRMNVIRGKMTPESFLKLYESLNSKYAEDVMAEAFGFANEADFKKLVKSVATTLPKDMQKDFTKAAEEIKTVDGLSKLLNTMFTKHGDTLPYGYMVVDFGGKDSVWLRMDNDTKKALLKVGKMCIHENRTVDDILGGLIRMAAEGELGNQLVQLIAKSDPVQIPDGFQYLPTADLLEA